MRLRNRLPSDLEQVLRLLDAAGLPPDGLERTEGWVLELDERIVGHVATEATAEALVLRSLVVDPGHRGRGLGERLMAAAEASAGARVILLKTETVGSWMQRRGYQPTTLGQVPASVRETTQFSGSLCAGTPIYLKEDAMEPEKLKAAVRERYAESVKQSTRCCGPVAKGCGCSGSLEDPSLKIGYTLQDLEAVPEGANLGLGCGNPVALATLQPGEVVLDLGSGAGFDAFLAAQRVGPQGRVLGVDMTPEMIARARELAGRHGYSNVEFRQGDIESLPVADASVDAIISNCVINLTTDKPKTFREAFRVLRPGGRLMVSDMVILKPLPEIIRRDIGAYAACLAGALQKEDYLAAIGTAGFSAISVVQQSRSDHGDPDPSEVAAAQARNPAITKADLQAAAEAVVSVQIQAFKPLSVTADQSGGHQGCC